MFPPQELNERRELAKRLATALRAAGFDAQVVEAVSGSLYVQGERKGYVLKYRVADHDCWGQGGEEVRLKPSCSFHRSEEWALEDIRQFAQKLDAMEVPRD